MADFWMLKGMEELTHSGKMRDWAKPTETAIARN
jgi:hypothetical protein